MGREGVARYRVTACGRCMETLLLQSDLEEMPFTDHSFERCPGCGALAMQWVAEGREGCMLTWGEEEA